ncbi:5'-nucleotidase C-terminal domain-containing protein [Desertivirga xinjiangensis]|uniref:5'-nucleotidase C-terminal domain-containing protein n=1 Tax=Desertivirga xinjiangensis TaxID=539206 RepID=UPI002108B46F|nr:5'-nucleotidase C-terminal domain-containing protein [Pedobacter xinjiangensis]
MNTIVGISKVEITRSQPETYHVFELMPFENYLVTLQLTGDQLKTLFDYMAANGGDPISKAIS